MSDLNPQKLFNFPVPLEEVEIYHDEAYGRKNCPFYHQFLIVPLRSKAILNQALQQKRTELKADPFTINWKKLRKETASRNLTAEQWLYLLNRGMRAQSFSYIFQRMPQCFQTDLGIKIGTFAGNLSDSFWAHLPSEEERTRRKYETLLRMGIKGCLHYCFNPEFTCYGGVKIKRFYTDAHVFGKVSLDNERILGRLEAGLRNYIRLEENIKIEHVEKSENKTPEVNLEELTDLALGSTRYIYTDYGKSGWLDRIVAPLDEVYRKKERGKSFKNSSHFRSFTLGICETDKNDNLSFRQWKLPSSETSIEQYNGKLNLK